MATFLFWNMQGKPLEQPLVRLVDYYQVDVLLLAECGFTPGYALSLLNQGRQRAEFHFPTTFALDSEKVRIFTRFSGELLESRRDHIGFRWTIRELFLPGAPQILVVAVHFPSKLNWADSSQAFLCTDLSRDIQHIESEVGHERSFIIGDFNMNPFEIGMLATHGLHAETTQFVTSKRARSIYGQDYPFFYNPMWNFFGDATRGPAGTIEYSKSEPVRMTWNMFDQLLLRPDLLPYFSIDEMHILSSDGTESFLTSRNGTPGANNGSDHLPILFKLQF